MLVTERYEINGSSEYVELRRAVHSNDLLNFQPDILKLKSFKYVGYQLPTYNGDIDVIEFYDEFTDVEPFYIMPQQVNKFESLEINPAYIHANLIFAHKRYYYKTYDNNPSNNYKYRSDDGKELQLDFSREKRLNHFYSNCPITTSHDYYMCKFLQRITVHSKMMTAKDITSELVTVINGILLKYETVEERLRIS